MSYHYLFTIQNETENNQQNGHEYTNKDFAEEQNFVPCAPLLFEDYTEKSVLVSANYGSANVWVRLVGQSADVSIFNHLNNVYTKV